MSLPIPGSTVRCVEFLAMAKMWNRACLALAASLCSHSKQKLQRTNSTGSIEETPKVHVPAQKQSRYQKVLLLQRVKCQWKPFYQVRPLMCVRLRALFSREKPYDISLLELFLPRACMSVKLHT